MNEVGSSTAAVAVQTLTEKANTVIEILSKANSLANEIVGPGPLFDTDKEKEQSCSIEVLSQRLGKAQLLSEALLGRLQAILDTL